MDMEDFDDFSDFEFEDPKRIISSVTTKRKKNAKVIGLDDLIDELQAEKNKLAKMESKKAQVQKKYDSDSDDHDEHEDATETNFNQTISIIQEEMGKVQGDDEMPLWGFRVFSDQNTWPLVGFPETESCALLRSFKDHKLNSYVEIDIEKGENILQGLLRRGWLLNLVYLSGRVEASIAKWTLDLLLYSSKEVLRTSASSFWSAILSKYEADPSSIKIEWLPCFLDLKKALEIYGFQSDAVTKLSSDFKVSSDSKAPVPPQNIRSWIKFTDLCCQMRCMRQTFSALDVQELINIIMSMFLDRQLVGLYVLLHECLVAAITSFSDDEWIVCLPRIAKSLATRLPAGVNYLRIIECISGVDERSKCLRSATSYQFLLAIIAEKSSMEISGEQEVLKWLTAINMKDKDCELFDVYIYLWLVENWIVHSSLVEDEGVTEEMKHFLRNCSSQITNTDFRPFAAKVRSKASYLLQGTFSQ